MEVAILSRYYKRNLRGVETYVSELSRRLQKLGYAVSIYPHIQALVSRPQTIISTNGRLDAALAKLWCLFHGSKLIIPGQSGLGFDDRLNLFVFPNTFVCLTRAQQIWAIRANHWVKTAVIPNGVDLAKFRPGAKPPVRPTILSVSALEPGKRLDLLIRAAAKTPAFLHLVGEGSQKLYLRRLAGQLMPGRVVIDSFPREHMPSVYAQANVFAYPTVPWESFGIAIVEAMASGLPVVATDDPIRREIVGDAGLFVDPTNIPAFTNILNTALQMKWKSRPTDRAKNYSWDQIALQYDQLINHLCSP